MNVTAYLLVGHYIFGLFCIPVICLSIMNVKPFDHRPKSTIASAVVMVSAFWSALATVLTVAANFSGGGGS